MGVGEIVDKDSESPMKSLPQREKMMLAGRFLSKFDRQGLHRFGFSSFSEAYNAMGYAISGKPTSIKNYRQEFDPLFPNSRQGWHGRPMRGHCRDAYEKYGSLSLDAIASLISSLLLPPTLEWPPEMAELAQFDDDSYENTTFSKRLITGAAAEGFFEFSFPALLEFSGHTINNVTRLGCGFDFRLQPTDNLPFLAVEVKGLAGTTGEIMMTESHVVRACCPEPKRLWGGLALA